MEAPCGGVLGALQAREISRDSEGVAGIVDITARGAVEADERGGGRSACG
jgi:hypothetical protein